MGDGVGARVGMGVGALVGARVGNGVGDLVGDLVGKGVGGRVGCRCNQNEYHRENEERTNNSNESKRVE